MLNGFVYSPVKFFITTVCLFTLPDALQAQEITYDNVYVDYDSADGISKPAHHSHSAKTWFWK